MTGWLAVGFLGGLVGLDTTSFPQAMVSRPLVAGTLTGAVFGRPMAGLVVGFIMEAFALLVLPIGAVRYPESGTAAVAAASAYVAVAPVAVPGAVDPGVLALAIAFGLGWEWVCGETVVLLRRGNGRILLEREDVPPRGLERRHLTAMTLDFVRGGVVAVSGGLIAAGLIGVLAPLWALGDDLTLAVLAVLTAAMVGTALPLFGGVRARKVALALGLVAGVALGVVLP